MAPLDLDKYVEIARLCKYLPENDLKVSPAGAGALLAGLAPSGSGAPAGQPFLSPRDPRRHPVAVVGLTGGQVTGSDRASRGERGSPSPPNAVLVPSVGIPRGARPLPKGCASWPSGYPRALSPDSFARRTSLPSP